MVDLQEDAPDAAHELTTKVEQNGTTTTATEDGSASPSQPPAATATQDIKTEEGESVNGEGMGEASSQSDTGNSIPMINLPDDIKNEDVKPVSFDEVLRSAPTVNRPFSFLR